MTIEITTDRIMNSGGSWIVMKDFYTEDRDGYLYLTGVTPYGKDNLYSYPVSVLIAHITSLRVLSNDEMVMA